MSPVHAVSHPNPRTPAATRWGAPATPRGITAPTTALRACTDALARPRPLKRAGRRGHWRGTRWVRSAERKLALAETGPFPRLPETPPDGPRIVDVL